MVIFTKNYGTLGPHLPIVWDKVPKKTFFYTFPNRNITTLGKATEQADRADSADEAEGAHRADVSHRADGANTADRAGGAEGLERVSKEAGG